MPKKSGPSGAASVRIELEGQKRLAKALSVFGDGGYLRAATSEAAIVARDAVKRRAPGSMGNDLDISQSSGQTGRWQAKIAIRHPGAKPMEFGDTFGRRGHRNSIPHKYPRGQKPKPFVGIVEQGHAIGDARDQIVQLFRGAMAKEWEKLSQLGDD